MSGNFQQSLTTYTIAYHGLWWNPKAFKELQLPLMILLVLFKYFWLFKRVEKCLPNTNHHGPKGQYLVTLLKQNQTWRNFGTNLWRGKHKVEQSTKVLTSGAHPMGVKKCVYQNLNLMHFLGLHQIHTTYWIKVRTYINKTEKAFSLIDCTKSDKSYW